MKTKGKRPRAAAELRRLAEHRLQERKAEKAQSSTEQDTLRLLHELQVHQVELEMQNEELIAARSEVEAVLERYTDLYDFAPVGYFTLDRDGIIRQVNITGAILLGIERSKLARHGLGRFVTPDDLNHWDQHLMSVLNSDEKQTCELALKREDGSTFCARLESIRFDRPAQEAGDGGTGPAIHVAMTDISDLKQAYVKLTEALAQLARSNRELESFAYTASHDLKGPLITITGFLGRLALDTEQGDAKRIQSDIARIGDAVGKMDRLLHDLLELSRIGRAAIPLEDVPLTELAREVANLLAGSIAERGVKVEIAPDLPTVHGARARLMQLFMNLLGNAAKFMGDQPDPQVKIGVRRDGEETVCYVHDNGIGIDPQHKDRIFGLFQKLDPNQDGTGVGLAVAKRVVEMHGGRIWFESDGPGKGSTFCFTLVGKVEPAG